MPACDCSPPPPCFFIPVSYLESSMVVQTAGWWMMLRLLLCPCILASLLSVQDWAVSGDLYNLGMKWYVPDENSVQFVSRLAQTFLVPQLEFMSSLTPSTEISKYVARDFAASSASLIVLCVSVCRPVSLLTSLVTPDLE